MNIAEYTLIDCATGLAHGPYDTLQHARDKAHAFKEREIIDQNHDLIAWSKPDAA